MLRMYIVLFVLTASASKIMIERENGVSCLLGFCFPLFVAGFLFNQSRIVCSGSLIDHSKLFRDGKFE